jgi:pilus assembly protein CpaE
MTRSNEPARVDAISAVDIKPIPRVAIQAFCETPEVARIMEQAAEDRRMTKAHVKVQMGGLGAALEFYTDSPTPNLVIVESREPRDTVLAQIDRLSDVCDPGTKVIVIGHINDVLLYRELTRRGVSEYLVAPFDMFDVLREIGDVYYNPDAAPLGRTIAVIGAKGGCGASTVAHNVAWSVAQAYATDVVLADLDLPWGSAGLNLNQDPTQGIADALMSPERVDDVYLDRLLAKCSEHLSLLAAPASLERSWEPSETAFEPIIDVVRGLVPTLVLDVPHVWTDWSRRTLRQADEVLLVAAPDLANLRNAKNIVDQLRQTRPNDSPPRLVLNTVGMPKRPEIKTAEFCKALDLPVAASVPFDAHLFGTAANNGQMIAEIDPKHAVAEAFRAIAQVATGRSEVRRAKKSALAPLIARLRARKAG